MRHNIPKMKNIFEKNFTKRNRFTRQCIGESVIALMQTKDFQDITISDIVKKAGVSRMTFYHYFDTKTDALKLSKAISKNAPALLASRVSMTKPIFVTPFYSLTSMPSFLSLLQTLIYMD